MKHIYILLIAMGCFTSCAEDTLTINEDPIGKAQNTIGLETTKVSFDHKAGTQEIFTKGNTWSFVYPKEIATGPNDIVDKWTGSVLKIEQDWIIMGHEYHRLKVDVKENKTSQKREFVIPIHHGNYFVDVYVTQAGKR